MLRSSATRRSPRTCFFGATHSPWARSGAHARRFERRFRGGACRRGAASGDGERWGWIDPIPASFTGRSRPGSRASAGSAQRSPERPVELRHDRRARAPHEDGRGRGPGCSIRGRGPRSAGSIEPCRTPGSRIWPCSRKEPLPPGLRVDFFARPGSCGRSIGRSGCRSQDAARTFERIGCRLAVVAGARPISPPSGACSPRVRRRARLGSLVEERAADLPAGPSRGAAVGDGHFARMVGRDGAPAK